MKLSEGIKLKGQPAHIPDCTRDDLPEFFKELGFKVGVEIGVYKGAFTEKFAQAGLEIYGVDPWRILRDYGNPRGQPRLNEQFRQAHKRLEKYPNAHLIRQTSMEALENFEDESLDFVYIDGNHLFRHVADDLYEWSFKLKQGGIMSGHDYAYFRPRSPCGGCHAREVVDAFAKAYRIPNFWVLGSKDHKAREKGETRDKFRSWMWFKRGVMPAGLWE